jgi:RNA recognition motif-containing protein
MTREEGTRIVERDVCAVCGIEPRLIDGFVCGLGGCPRKNEKDQKTIASMACTEKEVRKMNTRLFVGNINSMTERELSDIFAPYGCTQATIIRDRETHDSRGFGFVMVEKPEAAIRDLDRKEINGRRLHVEIAKPIRQRDYRSEGSRLEPFSR